MLGVLVLLIAVFAAGAWLNEWVEPQLQVIARQQTGIALNNIVQKVISTLDYDVEELVHLQRGEDGQILTLDYDTYALNQILGETLDKIDASLEAAQSGSRDPNLDEVLYEHGVIYHVALGSLTRFPFLSGIGPQVPFRFRMLNDVSGSFSYSAEPYGVNSTMITISLQIELKVSTLTILSITEISETMALPLVMEIVQGQIPEYYVPRVSS